jgi:hypothetical protein
VVPRYRKTLLKIWDDGGNLAGFLMLTQVGGKLSLPYACFEKESSDALIGILDHYLSGGRISYLTTYHPDVMKGLENSRIPWLGRRPMYQKFYATHELIRMLPSGDKIFFQDGDGDVVFT